MNFFTKSVENLRIFTGNLDLILMVYRQYDILHKKWSLRFNMLKGHNLYIRFN
jgi:hypothetical protein